MPGPSIASGGGNIEYGKEKPSDADQEPKQERERTGDEELKGMKVHENENGTFVYAGKGSDRRNGEDVGDGCMNGTASKEGRREEKPLMHGNDDLNSM